MVPSLLPGWKWWFPAFRQKAFLRQRAEGRGQKVDIALPGTERTSVNPRGNRELLTIV